MSGILEGGTIPLLVWMQTLVTLKLDVGVGKFDLGLRIGDLGFRINV